MYWPYNKTMDKTGEYAGTKPEPTPKEVANTQNEHKTGTVKVASAVITTHDFSTQDD